MNPLEHMAAWQSAFATPASNTFVLSLLFLFALLLARALVKKITRGFQSLRVMIQPALHALSPHIPRYVLQEAFSNGIIHSKVF